MSVSFKLDGKVAVVTGGGRGIGKAITRAFVEAGAKVAIASRKMDVLQKTADEFRSLGTVFPVPCHVGKREDLESMVATVEKQLGPIDIVVNNSATNIGQGPALNVTDDMLDKMVDVNVKASLRLINLTVPKMIERGTGGSIINMVSIAGINPQPGGLLYSFTKAGLIMMTRSWAREFGSSNIRVNAIAPGLIQTDFSEFFWKNQENRQAITGMQPLSLLGQPEDIAPIALYLASDASRFTTGQVFVIDGGQTA